MSTHFRPRPPASPPPSPKRPSTARSTIRAITPSPPPSLTEAVRLNYASTGTPDPNSLPDEQTVLRRPKSDGFHEAYVHGGNSGAAASAEAENVVGLARGSGGGMIMRRLSPAKHRSRSTSPVKKRRTVFPHNAPASQQPETPNKEQETQHQRQGQHHENPQIKIDAAQEVDKSYTSSDTDAEYPDTPTPMTTSQKRSAYVPLGTPTPPSAPHSKRSSKAKSKSSASSLSRARSVGVDVTSPPLPDQSHRHLQSHASPVPPRCADDAQPNVKASHGETREEPMLHRAEMERKNEFDPYAMSREQMSYLGNTHDSSRYPTEHCDNVSNAHQVHPRQPVRRPPSASSPDVYGNTYDPTPAPAQARPQTHVPGRNTSLSRVSATSNGTVASRKSIFSTPGRDELERKKALVEADEGPFARAVSMQELNHARRVISGEVGRGGGQPEGESETKERRLCGCNVM